MWSKTVDTSLFESNIFACLFDSVSVVKRKREVAGRLGRVFTSLLDVEAHVGVEKMTRSNAVTRFSRNNRPAIAIVSIW